jgi:hypothetical protein
MVELRKRKTPTEPAPPPAAKKNSNPIKKAVEKAKEAVIGESANGTEKLSVGDTIPLDGFGGEVETHDGQKTTLKKLLEESKEGVVLFTYPKASTPGCEFYLFFCSSSYVIGSFGFAKERAPFHLAHSGNFNLQVMRNCLRRLLQLMGSLYCASGFVLFSPCYLVLASYGTVGKFFNLLSIPHIMYQVL